MRLEFNFLTTMERKVDLLPKKKRKNVTFWFRENKESFILSFMIITGFSNNRKFKIRKIGKKMSNLARIRIRNAF